MMQIENTHIYNSNVESSELRTYCKMEGLCHTKLLAEEEAKKKEKGLFLLLQFLFISTALLGFILLGTQ